MMTGFSFVGRARSSAATAGAIDESTKQIK
jgi:hypothetical protein